MHSPPAGPIVRPAPSPCSLHSQLHVHGRAGELLNIHSLYGLEIVHAPAILGEAAVLAETMEECSERQATLRCVTHCTLWRLDLGDIEHLGHLFPELKCRLLDAFREHLLEEAEEDPDIRQVG